MIHVEFDDREILAALNNLAQSSSNIRPALQAIGENLVTSTKERFTSQTDPDGGRWDKLSDARIAEKVAHHGSNLILTDHGTLGDSINYQVQDSVTLNVGVPYQSETGSNMEYAAMMQFGGTKAEFPWLWGDIPARPFLGFSQEDKAGILDIIAQYLSSSIG